MIWHSYTKPYHTLSKVEVSGGCAMCGHGGGVDMR